jgi:hypothetical protein
MIKQALIISILFFPFEFISYKTETSQYHISCFILLTLSIFSLLRKGKVGSKPVLLLLSFFAIQFFLALFLGITPSNRFISGLVWFGGLLIVYSQGKFLRCDPRLIFRCITLLSFLSAIFALVQRYLLNIDRPTAFFYEPSIAGLFFWSTASAALFIFINYKLKFKHKLLLFVLIASSLYAGTLTKSMHMFSFCASLAILYLILFYNRISSNLFYKTLIRVVLVLLFVYLLLAGIIDFNHIADRLGQSETNLSSLSWNRGLDQALASINISPLFGLGLGSTGYFDFYSIHSISLRNLGMYDLNLRDAFSLLFRLVIEIGIVFICIFAYILFKRLMSFKEFFIFYGNSIDLRSISIQFIFVFSITIIVGCLIKEALYANSLLYVATYMVSSVSLKLDDTLLTTKVNVRSTGLLVGDR